MNKSRNLVQLVVLLLVGFFLFSLAGCQENDLVVGSRLQKKWITIQATYENLTQETKTVLHDDGHVYWSPHDSISLFYGSGINGGSKFIAQASSEVRVTNFAGEIGVVTGGDEISEDETFFWGLYPYDPESVCDGQTITAKISDIQIGAPNTFSPGTAPSLGHDQGLMLAFKNIYSGLIFSVKQSGFLSLTLTTNNGASIAGRAKIGIGSGNNPEVREVIDGTNSVTVLAPTPEGFEVGKNYYMILFPFTGGFTLRLNSATQTGIFSFTGSMTFARNKLNTAAGVDDYCHYSAIEVVPAMIRDANFRTWLFDKYDGNKDNVLSAEECAEVEEMTVDVVGLDIASLQGIEYFQNLVRLDCPGVRRWINGQYVFMSKLTELDVSHNKKLSQLNCYFNPITCLDLSKNSALTRLNARYCDLVELNISKCTELTYLSCFQNRIASLDVSNNPKLSTLYADNNCLTCLDLTHNPSLKYLSYGDNPLSNVIDISQNTELIYLECQGLSMTSLSVSHLPRLTTLYCYDNKIEQLDLSHNPLLTDLLCSDNKLSSLDLTNNPLLTLLSCNNNCLTSLDITNNPMLKNLRCLGNLNMETFYMVSGQNFEEFEIPEGVQIIYSTAVGLAIDDEHFPDASFRAFVANNFDNGDGVLTDLEREMVGKIVVCTDTISSVKGIEFFPNLYYLKAAGTYTENEGVYNGKLASIDLSGNPNLEYLYCYQNQLSALDVSANSQLKDMFCYGNAIEELNLSSNSSLYRLFASDNVLTNLDLSHNPSITLLFCDFNQINTLDLSQNVALSTLDVSGNELMTSVQLPGTLQSILNNAFRQCPST